MHHGEKKSANIFAVEHRIATEDRWQRNNHRSGILWFTGLSGAGKTTLALELERQLHLKGYQVYVLDGDNIRGGLNSDLGFSPEDRIENIRRIGEVATLFADAGFIVITAFISPYRQDRRLARKILPSRFHEVYLNSELKTCEKRDPKGLYRKARLGEIPDFTGVSAPYEAPENPELVINTNDQPVANCLARLIDYAERKFGVPSALTGVA
jgi:bifunctional enzyme CysN/CysC